LTAQLLVITILLYLVAITPINREMAVDRNRNIAILGR